MLGPNVQSTIRDAQNNVTYNVLAYRKLSRPELVASVQHFLAQPKVRRMKKPLKNKSFTIVTIIGATDLL